MRDFQRLYYEQETFWEPKRYTTPAESLRLTEILERIPTDIESILDVGCGNGHITNGMVDRFVPTGGKDVIGVDRSGAALVHVRCNKVAADVGAIPFREKQFDMVTAFEVLEHLPLGTYSAAIDQFKALSKKYIMITVPNEEDLRNSTCMCPNCYCWFNGSFHMRAFDKQTLKTLFGPEFNSVLIEEIGPNIEYRKYNRRLLALYRTIIEPALSPVAVCPQCGYQNKVTESLHDLTSGRNGHIWRKKVKSLIDLLFPLARKKTWLLALYVTNTDEKKKSRTLGHPAQSDHVAAYPNSECVCL
jgi:SAM-dependent methyltransferase